MELYVWHGVPGFLNGIVPSTCHICPIFFARRIRNPQRQATAARCPAWPPRVPGATAYSWRINECSVMKYCARRDMAPQVLNRVYRLTPAQGYVSARWELHVHSGNLQFTHDTYANFNHLACRISSNIGCVQLVYGRFSMRASPRAHAVGGRIHDIAGYAPTVGGYCVHCACAVRARCLPSTCPVRAQSVHSNSSVRGR
eukprot:gene12659-biopygen18504